MKLSAYLSPSRHGVYYVRWPLPQAVQRQRNTIRVSLRTKCPERVGDLARYLASCGRLMRDNSDLAGLRQHEIRDKVQAYFRAQLDQYLDWLDRRGLSHNALAVGRDATGAMPATVVRSAYLGARRDLLLDTAAGPVFAAAPAGGAGPAPGLAVAVRLDTLGGGAAAALRARRPPATPQPCRVSSATKS